jgi:hypothetical protein
MREANFDFLKKELEVEGRYYESLSYSALQKPAEEISRSRTVNGIEIHFTAEAYNTKKNGDLCFCIDASANLPTLLGVKPSYQFQKRADGRIYY